MAPPRKRTEGDRRGNKPRTANNDQRPNVRGERPRHYRGPSYDQRGRPPRPPARQPEPMLQSDFAAEEAPELGLVPGAVAPNVHFEADLGTIPSPSELNPPRTSGENPPRDFEEQIRVLEARLDGLIRRSELVEEENRAREASERAAQAVEAVAPVPTAHESGPEPPAESRPDSVTAEFVEQQWGRHALRRRVDEVDDFGLDPTFENRVRPAIDLLYRRYFRVQLEGIHHVPSEGRGVIVANHSGTLPLDGLVLRAAMRLDHPSARDLRWLAEDFLFHLPFAGVFLNRMGAVRACPENAERLLEKDSLVAVFPEGVQGIKKLFRERYQLQRFGRGGYIRLCLRTRTPLIPCAIIGAEETNPLLYRVDWLAELFRLPYLPVTPTFPLLGPLGLLPAPARWKVRFGEPISFDAYGPQAADDHVLVARLSERVRSAIQGLLDTGLRDRKSVWFG